MQILRRCIQIGIVLSMVIVALVNHYGILLEQKDDDAIYRSVTYKVIHSFFKGQDRTAAVEKTHKIKGTVWTLDVHGFKISDPLAGLESTALTLSFYGPLLLSIIIPLLLTFFFGRIFCGWICPMHLILEINDWLRKLLQKTGYNTRDIPFNRNSKYFVLIGGVLLAAIVGMPLLSLIYPPAVIGREIIYKVYRGWWGTGIMILASISFFELILSRRWWCRSICPGGAIYCAVSKKKSLFIERNNETCTSCGKCDPVCPYDLKPMSKSLGGECDHCGLCIAACKPKSLKYSFSWMGAQHEK